MQIKIVVSILFSAFFLQSIKAQFPTDMQYQSIAPPALTLPNYLASVMDASVPDAIQITRVTDYYTPWDWYPLHEYSKTQVWNADQTLIRIRSWRILDATTFQEVHSLSGSIYPSYWSNTNPDLIWSFKENGDIKKHTVSTETEQTVANIPGYDVIKLGPGEGNIDKNDHYVALVGKNGVDLDVIIFDLQTLQIVHTEAFAGAWGNGGDNFPEYIDWISISQSGDYVVIMWSHDTTSANDPYNTHYGVEVFNSLDMQYQNRIISYGNHGDLGYAIDGGEVLVQFYGLYGNGTLYMHKLDGSGSTVLSTNTDFGVHAHVSCRNTNRPGWAYIVHNLAAETGQMLAVKLDNSGLTEHFGHHFSSSVSYDKVPMPVASPDGDKIFFRSDFGDSENADLIYCFEAKLDPALPVKLISFSGLLKGETVELSWSTATEINNYGFDVQYSTNGTSWETIGFVQGKGVEGAITDYNFAHSISLSKINFYRLKQIDLDQSYEYSKTISINNDNLKEIELYPNPTYSVINLSGLDKQTAQIEIIDILGRIVKKETVTNQAIDISELSAGQYTVRIELSNRTISKQLVIGNTK